MVNSGKARGNATIAPRRRLSVEDRRSELLEACLQLIGARPWDEVTMADVAAEAVVSKPLLYHYFSTKSDLYAATVHAAAAELRAATRHDPTLTPEAGMAAALDAHIDWIDQHSVAYQAVLQSGTNPDPRAREVIDHSRNETITQLGDVIGLAEINPSQRIALRGWVGFLEAASVEWLTVRAISKPDFAEILATSLTSLAHALRRESYRVLHASTST